MLNQYFEFFGIQGGILLIAGVGILIFLLIAFVLERRTRVLFPERKKSNDDFDLFEFGDDEDDE